MRLPLLKLAVIISGLSAICLWGSAAYAWNALGHKMVAEIAWRGLSPGQRQSIVETIKRHPRFADDFIAKMPTEIELVGQSEKDHWICLHAGYWPDIARNIPADVRPLFDRPTWHYVNGPIYAQPGDRVALAGKITVDLAFDYPSHLPEGEWNIVQAIQHVRRILEDENTLAAERAVAYCWLFHLVADAHQPMHSCALFSASRFPDGDRGGNEIPLRQGGNLHALWDNLPGRSHLLKDVKRRTDDLYDRERYDWDAGKQLSERAWLSESYKLAKSFAYDETILDAVRRSTPKQPIERIDLSDEYLTTAGDYAKGRLVQAGTRLGAILAKVVPRDSVAEPVVRRVIPSPTSPPTAPVPKSPRLVTAAPEKPSATLSHWLNTGTGVRHNSSCRWYRNTSHGRMCGPNEGKGCGQCGG